MRRSSSSRSLPLIQRVIALAALSVATAGCGDDPPAEDAGVDVDAGVTVDTGVPLGPDMDSDEWIDDIDNCPAVNNPGQRDRDGDGIGDECDTCPSTPNSGTSGLPGQYSCLPVV
jgi:hypothetical protein